MTPDAAHTPVWPDYFADPFVWRFGSEYFAIGTGRPDSEQAVRDDAEPSVFALLRSSDLRHWTPAGHALVAPRETVGDSFWAPEIAACDDAWFLYYSVGHGDAAHRIRVAQSDTPLGPYVDVGALTSLDRCPFAIDAHPYRDVDGRWYLFHARDFLDCADEAGRPVRAGTAIVVHALQDMTALADRGTTIARARFDWQRFAADRVMYGRTWDWHTLEGPCVVRHDGRYYCFYSGGCWQDSSYGVDYVVADRIGGPWSDAGSERGPRVLRTHPGELIGPGHCSVVETPDGRRFMAYHAWNTDRSARCMHLGELVFRDGVPVVETIA